MAVLDFYALGDDLRDLFRFLYAETDVVVYELSSEFDREARCFTSLEEIEKAFHLGDYRSAYLQLWSPSVMAQPVIRRIHLTGVPGHSFRYAVEGAGLMQLYLDGVQKGIIYHTHYGHWNPAGAKQRSMHPAEDCDWKALAKLSGRIQRHIRAKLAVAKLFTRPVLRHAHASLQKGTGLWWGPHVHRADSPEIRAL